AAAAFGKRHVAVHACNLSESQKHVIEEESQPDAFAFAVLADKVHPIVPVTGTHEGQAVFTKSQAPQDGSPTVFVQTGRLFRPVGQIVIRVLFRVNLPAIEEVCRLVQYPGIPRAENVPARRLGQPEVIIRTVGAYASARWGMPPMLDIALAKLTGRAEEQVLTKQVRLGMDKRHHVLQLVAETEGTPRLVECAPPPNTAGESLVDEPAVSQDVEGLVGCFYLHRAQRVLPVLPYRFERVMGGSRFAETTRQVVSVLFATAYAEREDDLALLPVGQLERNLYRGTGVESSPRSPGQPGSTHSSRTPKRAVGVNFGDHVQRRLRPQVAENPFHVSGGGEPA